MIRSRLKRTAPSGISLFPSKTGPPWRQNIFSDDIAGIPIFHHFMLYNPYCRFEAESVFDADLFNLISVMEG
jgi:hypothetical protein